MKSAIPYLLFVLFLQALAAQTPVGIVLAPGHSASELRAAQTLQFYLGKMTGQTIVLRTSEQNDRSLVPVFVGSNKAAGKLGLDIPGRLSDDATFLQGKNGAFAISGGGEMGAEYAAYSLLELLGCRKYSSRDSFIPERKNLRFPDYQAKTEVPAFPYRELWYEPAFDEGWARWHKLKTNAQKNAEWGMFVHTFHQLCPENRYFKEHPEYFSWNGVQFSPGQVCLSNDTVLQIIIDALRDKIREKPQARYWSVSQNDNFDYCKCARCAASDRRYGGPAGTLIAFVNRVAAAFPDKIISTLAYQYTRQAPVGIRPADNVSVCLCSIECNRGLDIEKGCPDFARDVRAWSALTPNLMIWDYVVQFRSYLSPFPNWHTLQPNLRFFQENKVRMMFEQGSGRSKSEFSDMRAYLLAKLMWNPRADADSILSDFRTGYYGAAGPGVGEYIDSLSARLRGGDRWLGIYATPQTEAHTFLCPPCLDRYMDVLQKAIALTPPKSAERGKVLEATLPLLFADMELEKTRESTGMIPDSNGGWRFTMRIQEADVRFFVKACETFGYHTLHEMNYPPERYMADYLQYMKEGRVWHRFLQGKTSQTGEAVVRIRSETPPSAAYEKGDPEKLIDGKRGTDDYHYNWIGFQGADMSVTLLLNEAWPDEELPEVSSVSVQFLQDQASWVFFPEKTVVEISSDGQHFDRVFEENIVIEPDGKKTVRRMDAAFPPQKVRAIRVTGTNRKICPSWHPCNGNPCWIFADEIVVK